MLKKTLFILILIWSSRSVNAQQFIDTTKSWSIAECACGGWGAYYTRVFKFTSDTVINFTHYTNLSVFDTTSAFQGHIAQLREDTTLKRVFRRVGNQDHLIYDFNLAVGDTFHDVIDPWGYPCIDMIVDSISFNTYYGQSRKQWYFNTATFYGVETWVDGIGNLSGVMHNLVACTVDYDAILLCYQENNATKYYNSIFNTCFYSSVDVKNLTQSTNSFIVYPNPSSGAINVATKNISLKMVTIKNMLGELLFIKKTDHNSILIENLAPGIYAISVNDGRTSRTQLLVIK